MVLESHLVGGHVFEPPILFPQFIVQAQKRLIVVAFYKVYASLHMRYGLHVREGVKKHDVHCESKS